LLVAHIAAKDKNKWRRAGETRRGLPDDRQSHRPERFWSNAQADKVVLRVAQPLAALGANTLRRSCSVSAEIWIVAAATFSSSRRRWLVPAIGTI
jgi:hypothetical protein